LKSWARNKCISLYKLPIDKRTGDLQWRITHGAIATNKHVAHLDPSQGVECPFCTQNETLVHLFCECCRLGELFHLLEQWCLLWGECFSFSLFIFGPKYSAKKKQKHVLMNYVFGVAKLSIWISRKHMIQKKGSNEVNGVFLGLLASRLRIEYAYYKLTNNVQCFVEKWSVANVLCVVGDDGEMVLSF